MVTTQILLISNVATSQRSIPRLLLFLIYINGLHEAIKYSEVHHFADVFNLSKY